MKYPYIIITVLCCLLTVFGTLVVKAWTMDDKYALKTEVQDIDDKVITLRDENREDHKEIQKSLRDIAQILGKLEALADRNTP